MYSQRFCTYKPHMHKIAYLLFTTIASFSRRTSQALKFSEMSFGTKLLDKCAQYNGNLILDIQRRFFFFLYMSIITEDFTEAFKRLCRAEVLVISLPKHRHLAERRKGKKENFSWTEKVYMIDLWKGRHVHRYIHKEIHKSIKFTTTPTSMTTIITTTPTTIARSGSKTRQYRHVQTHTH